MEGQLYIKRTIKRKEQLILLLGTVLILLGKEHSTIFLTSKTHPTCQVDKIPKTLQYHFLFSLIILK